MKRRVGRTASMWCDDFDADLFKVVPGARDALAPAADVVLYTTGHTTGGKINHPTCWHVDGGKLACFVGFAPVPPQPPAYVTGAPIVACTFEELMRDLWVHSVEARMLVLGKCRPLISGEMAVYPGDLPMGQVAMLEQCMTALMWHARGNAKLCDLPADKAREGACRILRSVTARVLRAAADHAAGVPA